MNIANRLYAKINFNAIIFIIFLFYYSCALEERALVKNYSLAKGSDYYFIYLNQNKYQQYADRLKKGLLAEPLLIKKTPEGYLIYAIKEWFIKLKKSGIDFVPLTKKISFNEIDVKHNQRIRHGFKSLADVKTGYKDHRLNEILLKGIHQSFPAITQLIVIGNSRLGKPLYALEITDRSINNEFKIPVLFNASHHANELITIEHIYDIIYNLLIEKDKKESLLRKFTFWFVPIVNPDGNEFFWEKDIAMGRKNGYIAPGQNILSPGRGVDINRNYPIMWGHGDSNYSSASPESYYYRGPAAASEPETQAMMKLMEEKRFLYIISIHSQANSILYPYTIEQLKNPKPHSIKKLASRMAASVESYRRDKRFRAKTNLYPVNGTDQDYYYFKYSANALLVEVSHILPEYRFVEKILAGFRPMWKILFTHAVNSNKLFLKVIDVNGFPLEAEIHIEGIVYFNNEKRSSGKDGYFSQTIPWSHTFSVTVRKKGYKDATVDVNPEKEMKPIYIQLEKEIN